MAHVLIMIAQEGFRDVELLIPLEILRDAGHTAVIASIKEGVASGADGAMLNVEAIKDQKLAEFDCVMVIGGPGAPTLAKHKEVLQILKDAKHHHKKLAAICIAPTILAKAGVLKGKEATVFETDSSKKILEDGGAIFVKQSVVVQPHLVTGNGPTAAEEFGRKVVEMLKA